MSDRDHTSKRLVSRRAFLRRASKATAALPFLSVLPSLGCSREEVARRESALEEDPLLITMMMPDGVGAGWHCEGSGTDFTLSPAFAALAARRDKLVSFRHLDMPAPGGGAACRHRQALGLWTGDARNGDHSARGPSFDTLIGNALGEGLPLSTFRLACQTPGDVGVGAASFDMDGTPRRGIGSPRRAFTTLFGADPGGGEDPIHASILDSMVDDHQRLRSRLGAVDRARFEAHLEAVRELELRLRNPLLSCVDPGAPEDWPSHGGNGYEYQDTELTRASIEANRELAAMALACGHTRVVSMMYLQEGEGGRTSDYAFLDPRYGNRHEISHSHRHDYMPEIDAFDLDNVARLADRLDELGLFDRTLIVWGSGLSNGAAHDSVDLPVVMLGDACGRLRTGQLVEAGNRAYNDLVLTVLSAFGIGQDTFGAADRCTGPFSELLT